MIGWDGVSWQATDGGLVAKPGLRRILSKPSCGLKRLNVGGLLALLALSHIKADALILFQGLEAIAPNSGEVCEEILTTCIRGDEAETFGLIEPFDDTSCHSIFS